MTEQQQAAPPEQQPAPRGLRFGVRARWLTVALVVVVAVVIAVWPRGGGASGPTSISVPTPSLSAARAQADLAACPQATPSAQAAGTQLGKATVSCAATGRSIDFGSLVGAEPTLVNVWASWCPACQTELPILAQYAASPGAVNVVTLLVQCPEVSGLQSLAALHVHLPTVYDADNAASKALHLPVGLPASYLVRPDGTATLIDSLRVFGSVGEVTTALRQLQGGQ